MALDYLLIWDQSFMLLMHELDVTQMGLQFFSKSSNDFRLTVIIWSFPNQCIAFDRIDVYLSDIPPPIIKSQMWKSFNFNYKSLTIHLFTCNMRQYFDAWDHVKRAHTDKCIWSYTKQTHINWQKYLCILKLNPFVKCKNEITSKWKFW